MWHSKFVFVLINDKGQHLRDPFGDIEMFASPKQANAKIADLNGYTVRTLSDVKDGDQFIHQAQTYTKLGHDNFHGYIPAFDKEFQVKKFKPDIQVTVVRN